MFAGKKSAQIREILISESAWEEMTCLFAPSLGELSAAFKLSSTGIAKTSTGMKGLSTGNKLQHIPAGLESYKPYIQSKNSVEWIEWQTRGYEKFSALSDGCCPFCTGDSREKAEQISRVSAEYDKAVIKNLIGLIGVLDKLGEYFSEPARARLADITTLKSGLEKQHEEYLVTVKKQTDSLITMLNTLKTLNGFTFSASTNVKAALEACRLDVKFFPELQSDKTAVSVVSAPSGRS